VLAAIIQEMDLKIIKILVVQEEILKVTVLIKEEFQVINP